MRRSNLVVTAGLLISMSMSFAQTAAQKGTGRGSSKGTVRHRVQEESPVAKAETAIDKNNYAEAETLLRQAVAGDPKDYRAWFDLGFVLNAQGKTEEAIEAYRKSVAAKPDVFESNLNLGLMLAKTGSPDAQKYLKAATQLKPTAHAEQGWARAWLGLGHVLEKTNPQGAIEAFRAAATFAPKDAEPHLSAGYLLEQAKQFSAAETEYKRAAELDPKSTDAVAGLANVYMATGRMAEAETALRRFTSAEPNNAAAHVQLGRVLLALGKKDEATGELEAGLKLSLGDATATGELAELLIEQKKGAEAEALLRPALEATPNDARLHQELGRALMRQGKPADAQSAFLRAVQLNPNMGEAYGDLALAANDNKDYVLTIKALDARAKTGLEENPGTYFLRATAYDHLRDKKQAAEYYHLFLQTANGKFPDQEWQARHRLVAIEPKK